MLDLLIKGADVLDGTGSDAFSSDVGIKDGKIVAIGSTSEPALEVIDAKGLTLSPGWIDSHSHSDRTIEEQPDQKEKLEQGITFSITGQCGSSVAPCVKGNGIRTVKDFFDTVGDRTIGSGAALLVGHNSLRRAVMGSENRAPTPEEMEKMKSLLRESMAAGAIGMSFGLIYIPGAYSTPEEVLELAECAAECGGILASHIRGEGDLLFEAALEFLTVIKHTGARAVFSHHKAAGEKNWGKVKTSLAMIDKANEEGADIYLDVYPYVASNTSLSATILPKKFHPEGTKKVSDLLTNETVMKNAYDWLKGLHGNDLGHLMINQFKPDPSIQSMTVNEIADLRGESDRIKVAYDLLRESNCTATVISFSMCEEDVEYIMKHPRAMICTDSSTKGSSTNFHPRLRASFPRVLGRYVRERGVVSLPEMIRKMTSLPAKVYGLTTKGKIAVGMDADLCLFDPETIIDNATFKCSDVRNSGLCAVIIDGKVVLRDNAQNGVLAAKLYRKI